MQQLSRRGGWRRASSTGYSPARPPGPREHYPGAHLVALVTDKLRLFSEMARYGDVSAIRLGPVRLVLLTHPDDIRRMLVTEQRKFIKGRALERTRPLLGNGLLTAEGDQHLRQRRLVQPAFHRERIAIYGAAMVEIAAATGERWRDGESLDIHTEMMRLTLGIAGRTMFDVDVEKEAGVVHEALDLSLRMFSLSVLPMGWLLEHVRVGWVRDMWAARRRMNDLITRLIAERRADSSDRGDLLSMLVAAQDDGVGMSDEQLRDEIVTLLLAGHETTANALTWTWYLLSRHWDVERRLHAELDEVLGGRLPVPADVPRLQYTRRVLTEAMRLFPPAWMVTRRAIEPFEAGGHVIAPGTSVLASQYLVHRDRRWWRDPDCFDPERWREEHQPARPRFAYFPFGGGTRICVGEQFAWTEGILVLATLAQQWSACYEQQRPPVPEPLVTLRPRGGLRMRMRRRAR
ncbi:MAG TPA: cytochrome P450 [Gemmatimonadaceae bacterium]|nr:cytochrome P450 [Gemmatimonadaceae bacterium]